MSLIDLVFNVICVVIGATWMYVDMRCRVIDLKRRNDSLQNALKSEVETATRLAAALEYYAEPRYWESSKPHSHSPIYADRGRIARDALVLIAAGIAQAGEVRTKCHGSTHFFAPRAANPEWATQGARCVIGEHVFVRLEYKND